MSVRFVGVLAGIAVLLICMAASISFGTAAVRLPTVVEAIVSFDGSREHHLIRTVRLPRALIAASVGACLAMAGAIMQAVTRNALAGTELFGVNQGAALMIVLHLFVFGNASAGSHIGVAFLGAGLSGAAVYLLGSFGRSGLTPVKLVLAGAVFNLFFASLTQGILVFDEQSLDTMRFWLAGSLTGRNTGLFLQVLPFMAAGLAGTLAMSGRINLLSLGEDVAQGLGLRIGLVKTISLLLVVMLAGSSVAIAGPVGFVGLAVPHIVRALIGQDYRWVLPYSAVFGGILLLLADIAARFALPGQEMAAGVVTALLGAPFLIYLAQRRN